MFFALGFATRRWAIVVLPLIGWPVYAIGLDEEWWGCCGSGEAWQATTVSVTVMTSLMTMAGVLAGRSRNSRGGN